MRRNDPNKYFPYFFIGPHGETALKELTLTRIISSVGFGKKDQVQASQLELFNQLVLDHQDAAFNLAFYLLGDPDLAQDITQKAFINAYKQFSQFKGHNFRGWIMTIVRNACYDEQRSIKRRKTLSLDALSEGESEWSEWLRVTNPEPSPEQALERKERSRAVLQALDMLNADYRSAVVLVDLQGLDYQKAAQMIGIPVGTLKSRLARARRQLTTHLPVPAYS
jgi:RNA polymerase sigma-70 factor, ECF subfamily